jgi:hypothetical protein
MKVFHPAGVRFLVTLRIKPNLNEETDHPTRKRNQAYVKFNFLVELGAGDTGAPQAAFQECNIGIKLTVPEFHSGIKRKTVSKNHGPEQIDRCHV